MRKNIIVINIISQPSNCNLISEDMMDLNVVFDPEKLKTIDLIELDFK